MTIRKYTFRGVRSSVALAVIAVMAASSLTRTALVQVNPTLPKVRITRRPTKIKPGLLRSLARPPIAFKPLEMVDPRTGKPVTGNTMLKLDDGTTVITATKYYEQMNKLEAGLNKFGLSFRDQQKEVMLAEAQFDKTKTLAQIKSMKSKVPSPNMAAKLDALAQNQRAYARSVDPSFGKIPNTRSNGRISKGLFLKMVGNTMSGPGLPPAANTPKMLKKRPDLVPGNSAVTGLGSDVETLPGIDLDPGLAPAGKRASAVQINAGWSNIALYVNYLNTSTGGLAPRYIWQVVKATPGLDNFGSFGKDWGKDFGENEITGWKSPPGLIGSGNTAFQKPGIAPSKREHLFLIDFSKMVGNPPAKPTLYLVRVVPVGADGAIAGYPSRPVLVSYGAEPPQKIVLPPPPPPVMYPVNNAEQHAPNSIGDPSLMSLDLDTWMKSNGTVTQQTASVGFDAGCSVLGQPFSLLKISAVGELSQVQQDAKGKTVVPAKAQGTISYFALGEELPCENCDLTDTSSLSVPADYSYTLDQGFTFGFPVGPIDISGTVGFGGTIGFGGHVALSTGQMGPSSFRFGITAGPHVSAYVYMEAGAGIGVGGFDVLKVGVGGQVNLITAGFVVGLDIYPKGGTYYGRVSEFRVLDGKLYAFVKAGICPFCKKWSVTLFDWGGYDMLASDPGKMTLFEGKL